MTNPKESFDVIKLTRSFIIMVITGLTAVALHLTPGAVTTQFGSIIDVIATFILNTGPGLWLIYTFEKSYKVIMNTKAKIEAAHSLATGPGPPKG